MILNDRINTLILIYVTFFRGSLMCRKSTHTIGIEKIALGQSAAMYINSQGTRPQVTWPRGKRPQDQNVKVTIFFNFKHQSVRTDMNKRFIAFIGPKVWNQIDQHIRSFKRTDIKL